MTDKPDGVPAMPGDRIFGSDAPGMSLRDYFAAAYVTDMERGMYSPEDIAKRAYRIADAMLAERDE